MKYIDIEKEANEYFEHQPNEQVFGIVLVNAEQLDQANKGLDITEQVDVLEVVVNENVQQVVYQKYGGNHKGQGV